jgi:hypothetical protein
MKFTRLAVRFAIMTILCSTTAESIQTCPPGGCPPPPRPVIPTAVTTCACGNEAALEAAARSYLSYWTGLTPPGYTGIIGAKNNPIGAIGTKLIVVSTSVPISGIYYFSYSGGVFSLVSVNAATDAGAVANDISLLTRSVQMKPIYLPPSLTIQGANPVDLIATWVAGDMSIRGGMGPSIWHALTTLNIAAVYTAKFQDSSTGQVIQIYSGEAFTIYDSNGWSVQIIWNPFGPQMWTLVPGSVRDNHGNKVNIVNNVPTTPIPATGSPVLGAAVSVQAGPTWNPVNITPWQDNTPTGTATVGEPFVNETGGGNRETVVNGG